jgi:Helix-turn-helix domain/GAF domain
VTAGIVPEESPTDTDDARRSELRSFLIYQRSKLTPEDVALPLVHRRRVPGLRRQEVAELMSVSEDWYRWFESGRQISVSTKFLSRLGEVLKLNPQDTVTLYRLALPELYSAGATTWLDLPPRAAWSLNPIQMPSEIDEMRRTFDAARESFLTHSAKDTSTVRSRIFGSWKRSRTHDIPAAMREAPMALTTDDSLREARERNRGLLDAAIPILADLERSFGDMRYCVAIADREGRILFEEGDKSALMLVERAGIVPGADLSEEAAGTTGVGTVIADRRALQITAAEHYVEGGQPLTCTGAPIRDPVDGSIYGVLVVMGDYRLVRPTLLPAVTRCALAIEESAASASSAERERV